MPDNKSTFTVGWFPVTVAGTAEQMPAQVVPQGHSVIIKGTHRNWAKVMNDHGTSTSILKLTGRSSVEDLNFNLGTRNDGLIQTRGGARTRHCQFVGEDLTTAHTALWYDTNAQKHFKASDLDFLGDVARMTALKVDDLCCSEVEKIRIHECLVGIHVLGANAIENLFSYCDIGGCAKGLLLAAGSEQHFHEIVFHNNTLNVDDSVKDHIWTNIHGPFEIAQNPDNLVGINVSTGGAGVYGGDTQLIAAGAITNPFRIVGYAFKPSTTEMYSVRFTANAGPPYFDVVPFFGSKQSGGAAPSGTEFIFNAGTRISCSARDISGGDNVDVWVLIQEI